MLIMLQTMKGIDAFHDTSSAFSKYWKDHGGANAKLQLRSIHKIIPHVRNEDTLQGIPGSEH